MSHTLPNGCCSSCGQDNESGMSFCVNCGLPLTTNPITEAAPSQSCPVCGQSDSLSSVFCIYCGASMDSQLGLSQYASSSVKIDQAPHRGYLLFVPLSGALIGLLAALFLPKQTVQKIIIQRQWPSQGLVIYVNLKRAQIALSERSGKQFTFGWTGPSGVISLPNLAAGSYRLTICSPGYRALVKDVEIESGQPTVLGFPRRLELKANTNQEAINQ